MSRRRRAMLLSALLASVAAAVAAAVFGLRQAPNPQVQHLPAGVLKGANVLLMTIDTLRADHLGSYGSAAGLTPALDRLAREGLTFSTAYSAVPLTLPSHTSILTGEFPTVHGVRDNGSFRFDGRRPTLATTLKAAGYRTAAFVGAFVLDARFGLNAGFDLYDDFYGESAEGRDAMVAERRAEEVLRPADVWIRKASDAPWFAWVHLYDPHEPYTPPQPFGSRYASNPYSGEIAYADAQLGSFVDRLRAGGALEGTLVMIAADHGESLGQHGERTHGLFAYDATIKVPWIIWCPRAVAPARYLPAVRLVDLVPTTLDLLGVPVPAGLGGRSLRPMLNGDAPWTDAPGYFEALNASLTRNWAPLTGIVSDGFKLIDLPVPELYDLSRDPAEQQNLYDRRAGTARTLRVALNGIAKPAVVAAAVRVDRAAEERLRSLGYVVAPAARRSRVFTRADDPKALIGLQNRLEEANLAFDRGDADRAVEILTGVIAERTDFALAYARLAHVYRRSGRLPQAVSTLEIAVRESVADAALSSDLGLYLQEAGSLKESAAVLEGVVGANSIDLEAASRLGITYARLGRLRDAERMFGRVLAADPNSATAHANLGSVALADGHYADALAHFERALAVDPALPGAHNGLGVAYANSGQPARAIEEWKKVLAVNDSQVDTLYNLGRLLAQEGRQDEAIEYLERFARTAPADRYGPDLVRVQKMLARMRSMPR